MLTQSVGFYFLLVFWWATVLLWLVALWWTRRELNELKPLSANNCTISGEEPFVSVLLPARNEENRVLDGCVNSLLAQNYQNFEIIAVNDRSTDQTGEILRRLAQTDSKLQIIEGAELPADWLGKPFALRQAFEKAAGEWILATDADIIFAPQAVETAVYYAEQNQLDALCLIPFDICETFWETIFLTAFGWLRMLKMPPTKVNSSHHAETMGVGNFFLVRRSSLAKINGFGLVKGEVAEDLRLAELLKKSGARFRLDYAPDLLQTRMYAGLREIWAGFTKNLFAGSNFSLLKTISGVGSIMFLGVLPIPAAIFCLAAWLLTGQNIFRLLFIPAILIYICQIIVFAVLLRAWTKPLWYALLAPLGLGLFAAILINSAARVATGRGVLWKGRAIYRRGSDGTKSSKQFSENG